MIVAISYEMPFNAISIKQNYVTCTSGLDIDKETALQIQPSFRILH